MFILIFSLISNAFTQTVSSFSSVKKSDNLYVLTLIDPMRGMSLRLSADSLYIMEREQLILCGFLGDATKPRDEAMCVELVERHQFVDS